MTQGRRPDELRRGLESLRAQDDVVLDIVCVGNGADPGDLPDGVRPLVLDSNAGIPAGRNRGAAAVTGEFVFFLDDDAWLPEATFLRDAVAVLRADPGIGLLQPRVTDPASTVDPRRWIPRIRKGPSTQSGDVYFYAHEGIELAWRVWAAGRRAWYEGSLTANHPNASPTRHSQYYRLNARNRVWLAKRNLPWPLVPVYVATWTGVQVLRWTRHPDRLRPWFAGFREGWLTRPGGRRSMGWRTVVRMARAGRPPII